MENSDYISIVAIIFAAVSIIVSIVTYVKSINRDRKRETLEAYNRLQNEVFDKLNLYKPSKIVEISKNNLSEEYKEISGYIARIEHFCVGVNSRIYDKKVVYELAHGYLDGDQIGKRINPFIEKKNSNSKNNYYGNISKVIEWMNKETKKTFAKN